MKPSEAAAQEIEEITRALHSGETVSAAVVGTFVGPTRWAQNQHRTLALTGQRLLIAGVVMQHVLSIPLRSLTSIELHKGLISNTVVVAYEKPGQHPRADSYFFSKRDAEALSFVELLRERTKADGR